MAVFNSREYEWADVTAIVGGNSITGLRGIKYTEKVEREVIHAKGRYPHSIQTGNITIEGEIKMLQSEFEALSLAGKGSILNLSVDVIANYGNPAEGNTPLADRIMGVRFTEAPKEINQGDKFMEITLPFIALNIKRNVK